MAELLFIFDNYFFNNLSFFDGFTNSIKPHFRCVISLNNSIGCFFCQNHFYAKYQTVSDPDKPVLDESVFDESELLPDLFPLHAISEATIAITKNGRLKNIFI